MQTSTLDTCHVHAILSTYSPACTYFTFGAAPTSKRKRPWCIGDGAEWCHDSDVLIKTINIKSDARMTTYTYHRELRVYESSLESTAELTKAFPLVGSMKLLSISAIVFQTAHYRWVLVRAWVPRCALVCHGRYGVDGA